MTVDVGGTVGELAWGLGGIWPDEQWTGRLWYAGAELLAWATLQRSPVQITRPGEREVCPDTLDWQVDPACSELLHDVLDWAEDESRDAVATSVRAANQAAVVLIEERGYSVDDDAAWNLLNARSLNHVEEPVLPRGFELLTVAELKDVKKRVDVHRAAWEGSRMTVQRYEGVMGTWPYSPDLDCVVAGPAGEFVASALAWFDPDLVLGELEPVGTHAGYRRRGLARAVNLFALQRLRDAGAEEAIVACRGDDDYPVPKTLYESVGFRELSRQVPYVKSLHA